MGPPNGMSQPKPRLDVLRTDEWFRELPARLQDDIVERCVVRKVPAWARVYSAGDGPAGMFAVLSGEIRLVHHSHSGKYAFYALMRPGAWFGALSELDGRARFTDAIASTETTVLQLGHAAFQSLYADNPAARDAFVGLLCRNLRTTLSMLVEHHSLPPRQQVAQILLSVFTRPDGAQASDAGLDLTQEALAAMAGVSRQTVNKVLHQFSDEGLIRVQYGRIVPLDLHALDSIVRDA